MIFFCKSLIVNLKVNINYTYKHIILLESNKNKILKIFVFVID